MSGQPNPFTVYLNSIEPTLSTARLGRYRHPGDDDRQVIVNYLWNMALSEALYPALHALEVSLRNAIHSAAMARNNNDRWFETRGLLIKDQPNDIIKAKLSIARQNKQETSGRIISELNFGFWTTLLSGSYEVRFWRPRNYALLTSSFPYLPRSALGASMAARRHDVHQRYNNLRILRNRVFHFEPIWDNPRLQQRYSEILESIGWINPVVRDTVIQQQHFPQTLASGRAQIEATLDAWLS